MKRKRFIKIAMAAGYSRNEATDMADRCTGVNRLITAYELRMYISFDQTMKNVRKIALTATSLPYVIGIDTARLPDRTARHECYWS